MKHPPPTDWWDSSEKHSGKIWQVLGHLKAPSPHGSWLASLLLAFCHLAQERQADTPAQPVSERARRTASGGLLMDKGRWPSASKHAVRQEFCNCVTRQGVIPTATGSEVFESRTRNHIVARRAAISSCPQILTCCTPKRAKT